MPVEKLDRHGCNFLELITVSQTDENELEKLIILLMKRTGGIARGLRGYLFLLKKLEGYYVSESRDSYLQLAPGRQMRCC